jgi:hypothetical protein
MVTPGQRAGNLWRCNNPGWALGAMPGEAAWVLKPVSHPNEKLKKLGKFCP